VPQAELFDLDRYLARIGYRGALDTTLATLGGLHRSHVAEMPFENLDVQLGRPIRLDLLDVKRNGAFLPLYAFTLEEQFAVDYELANYFASTHPASRFVQMLVVARPGDGCRYSLSNREFGVRRGDDVERRTLQDDPRLFAALERYFGLRVDPQSRFRAVHGLATH
jgi:N-hydroxyarylamine O-acetyltransferase